MTSKHAIMDSCQVLVTFLEHTLKGEKVTISLAQARDAVPGPNCMLKSLWG